MKNIINDKLGLVVKFKINKTLIKGPNKNPNDKGWIWDTKNKKDQFVFLDRREKRKKRKVD